MKMFLFRDFAKAIFILSFVFIFAQSVHGGSIQKVEYQDGVVEYDDSSPLEDIPPREEWFHVSGSRSSHQQRSKSVAHSAQDIIALDSTRPRDVEDENSQVFIFNIGEPMEENRDHQTIQVEVRNHGRIGFRNDRAMKKSGHLKSVGLSSSSIETENYSQEGNPEVQMQQSGQEYSDRSESDSSENDVRINPPPHEQVAKMARFIVRNSSEYLNYFSFSLIKYKCMYTCLVYNTLYHALTFAIN